MFTKERNYCGFFIPLNLYAWADTIARKILLLKRKEIQMTLKQCINSLISDGKTGQAIKEFLEATEKTDRATSMVTLSCCLGVSTEMKRKIEPKPSILGTTIWN